MKRSKVAALIVVAMSTLVGACGQTAETVPTVEESAAEAVVAETEVAEEEPTEEADPCEVNGHTWVEATCTEPKTCSVCGETEGEPLGHDWDENTPNYQQAKTCLRCGETEGEPLPAAGEGLEFAELNKEYDFEMICTDDHSKTTIAKVWFDNYNIFDSDDKHEAKDGYEYRSVDMHFVVGDDNNYKYTCNVAWGTGEYYLNNDEKDDGTLTVNYLGKEYDECTIEINEVSKKDGVTNKEYAEKYGWSGEGTGTFVENCIALVPKGFDGAYCFWLDYNEYQQNDGDFDACNNVIYFRLD